MRWIAHATATQTACEPDEAVRTDRGSIHPKLGAFLGVKPCEQDRPFIRAPVAVGVPEKKKVRRTGGDQPVLPGQDAVWKGKTVGKHGALVHASVVVQILEQSDHAHWRLALSGPARIAAIFRHIKAPALVKRHGAWRSRQRL